MGADATKLTKSRAARQDFPPRKPSKRASPTLINKFVNTTKHPPSPKLKLISQAPQSPNPRNVEYLASASQCVFAYERNALPETPPAVAPTSPTRAIDGERGRPGEPDADDGGPGTEHARSRWLLRWDVSASFVALSIWS